MPDQKKPNLMDLTTLVTSDYPDLADESEDKPESDMLAQMDHDAIRQFLKRQGYDVHKHRSAKAAISQANDVAGKEKTHRLCPHRPAPRPAIRHRRNGKEPLDHCRGITGGLDEQTRLPPPRHLTSETLACSKRLAVWPAVFGPTLP